MRPVRLYNGACLSGDSARDPSRFTGLVFWRRLDPRARASLPDHQAALPGSSRLPARSLLPPPFPGSGNSASSHSVSPGLEEDPPPPHGTRCNRFPASDLVAGGFEAEKLVVHRTSGSSGEPFSIRRTPFEDRLLQAYRLAILFRLGMRLTDRRMAVVTARFGPEALYMKLGLLRYEEVDCLESPEEMLRRLRAKPPGVLRGFPGTLSWLAGYIEDADRAVIHPKFVTTDSELMTADMRARIAEGFGAKVVDFYDSHEFNMIGWECQSGGLYHVSDLSMIAEVDNEGGAVSPGEDGELVGTALHSWAMPFIRFRLGDLVTRGPLQCPCGATNSTLMQVQGRLIDRFVLPDGRTFTHTRWSARCWRMVLGSSGFKLSRSPSIGSW